MSSHWLGAKPPNHDQIPVVNSILKDFSGEALGELRTWLEQNPPSIPVTQILGFSQFTASAASVPPPGETTASTTYTDLATVGPQLTGLPDGKYVVFFGCTCWANGGSLNNFMSVKYSAAEALDDDGTLNQVTSPSGISRAVAVTLAGGGNNTIKARYKVTATNTGTFTSRWLVALRYANA